MDKLKIIEAIKNTIFSKLLNLGDGETFVSSKDINKEEFMETLDLMLHEKIKNKIEGK